MIKKNFITIGLIIFILFSLSLILGLYLNEDASGLGTSNDFKSTWPYVLSLKNNYIIDGSEWTRLLPLHYIFLSLLQENLNDIFLVRLFFVFISLLIPFLFYLNLKIKFPEIDKGKLLIISSIIIILPFFRSSSIWPNPHITSLVFLLSSFYFFSKWEQLKIKVFDRDLILHIIFLALAVYTRRYYIFFFLYFLIIYFTN